MLSCLSRRNVSWSNQKACVLVQRAGHVLLFNKKTCFLGQQEDVCLVQQEDLFPVQQEDMSSCSTRRHAITHVQQKTCLLVQQEDMCLCSINVVDENTKTCHIVEQEEEEEEEMIPSPLLNARLLAQIHRTTAP